jgi:hypothetical protein
MAEEQALQQLVARVRGNAESVLQVSLATLAC